MPSQDGVEKKVFWRIPGQVVVGLCVFLIRGYQVVLSPLFPPSCRYSPTCSQYAIEAIKKYGVLRGTGKALWRILRCHPFSKGGYDPVK